MVTLENIIDKSKLYNLRELCSIFNFKYIDSTDSRKSNLKKIESVAKLEKIGRKYKIIELYKESKKIIDNRKGNSGLKKGCEPNNKGKFAPLVDILILRYLQDQQKKQKQIYKIYTTNNKIAENIGIINCNYRTALAHQAKFYNTVKEEFDIEDNKQSMLDSFEFIKSKLRELIRASLDRIMELEKLEFEFCYFIITEDYETKELNEKEFLIITGAEESTLLEMKITKKTKDNNAILTKEFNRKVLEKVKKELEYVKGIYQGYNIFLSTNEKCSDDEFYETKIKLNKLILEFLYKQPVQKREKTILNEGLMFWFGCRNPYWKKWTYDRMSNKYIQHCNDFIKILCDVEAENIRNKILDCKKDTIETIMTQEYKENKKDKLSDRIIKLMGY